MIEYLDPDRMRKNIFDQDLIIDNKNIKASDILFFLTDRQLSLLKSFNIDKDFITTNILKKNYDLVIISELKLSWSYIKNLGNLIIEVFNKVFKNGNTILINLTKPIIIEYLHHAPLFDSYKFQVSLHTQTPNGRSGWRFNSSIITGLCRKNETKSYGYQTRVFDSKQYEHSFECYDIWFSWGSAWDDLIGENFKYVKKIVNIGPLYVDALRKQKVKNTYKAI